MIQHRLAEGFHVNNISASKIRKSGVERKYVKQLCLFQYLLSKKLYNEHSIIFQLLQNVPELICIASIQDKLQINKYFCFVSVVLMTYVCACLVQPRNTTSASRASW